MGLAGVPDAHGDAAGGALTAAPVGTVRGPQIGSVVQLDRVAVYT